MRSAAWIKHSPRKLDAPPPGVSNLIRTSSSPSAASHHHPCWVDRCTSLDRGIRGSGPRVDVLCDQAQRSGGRSPLCRAPRGRETRSSQRRLAAFRTSGHEITRQRHAHLTGADDYGRAGSPLFLRHLRRPLPAATRSGRFFFGPVFSPSVVESVRYDPGSRRSGRVAEGGALLRRYGGECLHRGFESLLLRFTNRYQRTGLRVGPTMCPWWAPVSWTSCVKCAAYQTTTSWFRIDSPLTHAPMFAA